MTRISPVAPTSVMRRLVNSTRAAATTEYGILMGLVAIVGITALSTLGLKLRDIYSNFTAQADMAEQFAEYIANHPQLQIQNSQMFIQSNLGEDSEWVLGTDFDEYLSLAEPDNVEKIGIMGFSGDDGLYGRTDPDRLDKFIGGPGNDTLMGLAGPDEYIFERGWGKDELMDFDSEGTGDFITFEHYNADDIYLLPDPNEDDGAYEWFNDMIVTNNEGDEIHIEGQFINHLFDKNTIESIHFADGQLDLQQLRDKRIEDQKRLGRTIVYGSVDSDNIYIRPGEGEYMFLDPKDWLSSEVTDRLYFEGYKESDVKLGRTAVDDIDLDIHLPDGRMIKLLKYFDYREPNYTYFDDATLVPADMRSKVVSDQEGNPVIFGTPKAETFVYHRGTNVATTYEDYNHNFQDYTDTLDLSDFSISEATFQRASASDSDDNILITLANGERITLKNQIERLQGWGMDRIAFSDQALNSRDAIFQKFFEDSKLTGHVVGTQRPDDFHFRVGDGDFDLRDPFWVYDLTKGDDLYFDGLAQSDVTFQRDGNDLLATIDQTGATVRVINQYTGGYYRIKYMKFTDGTLSYDAIEQKAINDAG